MKVHIYLPDELQERLRQRTDINVSAICQDALRDELERRIAREKDMERVKVFDEQRGDVSFIGQEVHIAGSLTAYLTARNRVAVYDVNANRLEDYDRPSDIPADVYNPRFLAALQRKLADEFDETLHLDI